MVSAAPADSAVSVPQEMVRELRLCEQAGREAQRHTRAWGLLLGAARGGVFAVILAAWALASGRWVDRQFIADPLSVLGALGSLVGSGRLWPDLAQTMVEVLSGYAIGATLGVALALMVAFEETLQRILRPFLIAFYSIPKIALAPVFVMWFGLGLAPKVVLAAMFVFFVVFMNMVTGLYQVSPILVNAVRVMGATRRDIVWKVALPSSTPYLMTGLRIAIPEALIGAVIGEFMSATAGLGYLVNEAAQQFNMAVTLAAIVALLVVVLAMDAGITALEGRLLRWRSSRADLASLARR